jgi:6-phosphogluconolactonase
LNHAAEVMFLASGAGKAHILREILDPSGKQTYPAQGVHPESGKLIWLADKDAANLL